MNKTLAGGHEMRQKTPATAMPASAPEGLVASLPQLAGFNCSGVYFLYRAGVVVYVGQSIDVRKRIGSHLGDGLKDFDSFSFIPCLPVRLLNVERRYIQWLRPEYNRACNPDIIGDASHIRRFKPSRPLTKGFFTESEAAKFLGMTTDDLQAARSAGHLYGRRMPRSKVIGYRVNVLEEYLASRQAKL